MKRKLIKDNDIINLSKSILQHFYSRTVGNSESYLSDDFMWIGAFDFQYTMCKSDFLNIIKSELNAVPFNIMNEEFFVLSKSPSMYVVCGKYKLIAQTSLNTVVRTHTRVTIIWKYVGDDLKIFHIHGSNSQDIPLSLSTQNIEFNLDTEFFAYLNSLNTYSTTRKIKFRDTDGKYLYFLENDILYLEPKAHNTMVHTINDDFLVSGLLAKQAEILPNQFFRIHKSYIINANFVTALERYTVTLMKDIKLPVSKEKFIALREFIDELNYQKSK